MMSDPITPEPWVIDRIRATLVLDPITGKLTRSNHTRTWLNGKRAGAVMASGTGSKYRRISFRDRVHGRAHVKEHHVIYFLINGVWPTSPTDHVNGDGTDNSDGNLRPSTTSQNQHNTKIRRDNTSGAKGVTWHIGKGKFHAYIKTPNGPRKHLGYFDGVEDAARAYDAAAIQLYGEFAKLNLP